MEARVPVSRSARWYGSKRTLQVVRQTSQLLSAITATTNLQVREDQPSCYCGAMSIRCINGDAKPVTSFEPKKQADPVLF